MQSPTHPKDDRREIPPCNGLTGEVNFCFPALFSDYAEWSGVEWDSAHRNAVTRENQVYRKSLEVLARAPRTPVRPVLHRTESNVAVQ